MKTTVFIKKIFRFLRFCMLFFFSTTMLFVIIYRFVDPPETFLMLQRKIEARQNGRILNIRKQWVRYNQISVFLKQSVILSEDISFFFHKGFDFQSIREAYAINKKNDSNTYGASTISQQVARNVFLWNGRSWMRKILEAYFTVLVEVFWNKKRILEVYLNVIEFGDGIFGAEQASQIYFNVSANLLSNKEASLLAAILPNPRKWSPISPIALVRDKSKTILWRQKTFVVYVQGL